MKDSDYKLNKEDIEKMTPVDLASMIVISRILGTFRPEAKACMIELMNRKSRGDTFDFESFIKENYEKYKIKLNLQSFTSIKSKISTSIMESLINIDADSIIDDSINIDDEDDQTIF